MVYTLQGTPGTVNVELDQASAITVAPRTVATIVATTPKDVASLKLSIGEGAGVHLVLTAVSLATSLEVEVAAGATFVQSAIDSSGKSYRLTSLIRLVGEGANVHCQVAVLGRDSGGGELDLTLDHVSPRTCGRITARRVQADSSSSSLRGTLKIALRAHGTDTYLSDKVLLVGEHARAMSIPSLEILADDVKASHGATIGRLSADELFYLRSRGLPEARAHELLVRAFLAPALTGVPLQVVARLERSLAAYATQPA